MNAMRGLTKSQKTQGASLGAQWQRLHLPMQETQVQSLGQEDPQEKEMATHSNILAWEIPWTVEPGGLQSMELQRVTHNLATKQQYLVLGGFWLLTAF